MIGEIITLGLFLTGLGLCIFTGVPILYALVFGCLLYTSPNNCKPCVKDDFPDTVPVFLYHEPVP